MIKDMISVLDEDFTKLSLIPSFKAPKYSKEDLPIHALDLADHAHSLDEDLHCMTVHETELQRSLKPLSWHPPPEL